MNCWKKCQIRMALVACCGFLLQQPYLFAQQADVEQNTTSQLGLSTLDVELTADGTLIGQVINTEGKLRPGTEVVLKQAGVDIAQTTSDAQGNFRFPALRGGAYQIVAGGRWSYVRAWVSQTAPPSSRSQAVVVAGNVIRGQGCTVDSCTGTCGGTCAAAGRGGPMGFLLHPLVIGAAVAAAIAIPLAVSNNDKDESSP